MPGKRTAFSPRGSFRRHGPRPGTRRLIRCVEMGKAGWLLTFNAGSSSLKVGVFEYRGGLGSRLRVAVRDIGRDSSALSTGTAAEDLGHIECIEAATTLVLDRLENGIDGTTADRRS